MGKFIITEEEKNRILNLYEDNNQPVKLSDFTKDVASMLGLPEDQVSYVESFNESLDSNTRKQYYNLFSTQSKNITLALSNALKDNKLDGIIDQFKSYSKPMNSSQEGFINIMMGLFDKFKLIPKDQVDNLIQQSNFGQQSNTTNTTSPTNNTTPSSDEKINTTNDRSYDYKLSGGKYYYSAKGQNKWIEAKGNGLTSIKSKVKF